MAASCNAVRQQRIRKPQAVNGVALIPRRRREAEIRTRTEGAGRSRKPHLGRESAANGRASTPRASVAMTMIGIRRRRVGDQAVSALRPRRSRQLDRWYLHPRQVGRSAVVVRWRELLDPRRIAHRPIISRASRTSALREERKPPKSPRCHGYGRFLSIDLPVLEVPVAA